MSLLWRGEEEKGGPIGDFDATNFQKCTRGHVSIYELFVSYNIPGVLPAKWATKGKEMSQVNFLFVYLSPVCIGPLLFLLQISINCSHSTTQAWLGALV